ncbi:MAG TPA: Nif3-like dinuclear metal center hexameric protein [Gemmataceae bacterium]|nr:Nif3-like dinuclear metal center hexameric protein [Gemmataceae bacterium]
MPTVADIERYLRDFAPPNRATEWDNVGLILGDRSTPVSRILTCLTVTPEVVEEAIAAGVQLIVTHHPMLFRAVKKLTDSNAEGRMALALLRHHIAVYSPHTAFDNCRGGINELLAERLGLVEVRPLRPFEGRKEYKFVVFVPEKDLTRVSDAIFAAGAGVIGQYSQCSFRLAGTGTFFGSDAANPTLGQKGRREEVSEWRLEAVCPESSVDSVIAAMRKAHSYEEPAFDVYPLRPVKEPLGEGRFGRLPQPAPLAEWAAKVRSVLKCGPVQVIGELTKSVATVALACGAAGEYLGDAVRLRADVFLSGEMRFHDYLAAQAQEIGLVLPGHYATERPGIEALAERLQTQWPETTAKASEQERDPVAWA